MKNGNARLKRNDNGGTGTCGPVVLKVDLNGALGQRIVELWQFERTLENGEEAVRLRPQGLPKA